MPLLEIIGRGENGNHFTPSVVLKKTKIPTGKMCKRLNITRQEMSASVHSEPASQKVGSMAGNDPGTGSMAKICSRCPVAGRMLVLLLLYMDHFYNLARYNIILTLWDEGEIELRLSTPASDNMLQIPSDLIVFQGIKHQTAW